jgi:hypothetical protein
MLVICLVVVAGCGFGADQDIVTGRFPDVCGALDSRLGYSARHCAAIVQMKVVDRSPETYWVDRGRLEVRPDIAGRPPVGSRFRARMTGSSPCPSFSCST